jgi:hypothetical protein
MKSEPQIVEGSFGGFFSPEAIESAIKIGSLVKSNKRNDGESLMEYTQRLREMACVGGGDR